jgi:hypothetical protein
MFPIEVFSYTFAKKIKETFCTSLSASNIVNSNLLVAAQPLNSAAIVLKSKTLFYVAGLPGLGVAH